MMRGIGVNTCIFSKFWILRKGVDISNEMLKPGSSLAEVLFWFFGIQTFQESSGILCGKLFSSLSFNSQENPSQNLIFFPSVCQEQQKADNPVFKTMTQELMLIQSPEPSVRQNMKLQYENDLKIRKASSEKDTVNIKVTDCFCEVEEATFSFLQ